MASEDAEVRTRVLVVDDHEAMAEALVFALDLQPDVECVAAATNVPDAIDAVVEHDPDVVLIDVMLPGIDGVEGTRRIKAVSPRTTVIVLTGQPSPEILLDATRAGAAGFLQKAGSFDEILQAVRRPADGQIIVDARVLASLSLADAPADRHDPGLTGREMEVLRMMGKGMDPSSISKALHLSVHTVRGYVKAILSKLGAHTQLEAVVIATRTGVLRDLG